MLRALIIVAVSIAGFTTDNSAFASSAEKQKILHVGKFSTAIAEPGSMPANWEVMTFPKISQHTRYKLIKDNGVTVIQGFSNASASGLIRKIRIDIKEFPVIEWKWKISNVYKKGNAAKKAGDDYPARIYIAFEFDSKRVGIVENAKFAAIKAIHGEYPPVASISYIWGSSTPKGTSLPNPYTDRVKMVIVESGAELANTWIKEKRNIYKDYLKLFGNDPPMTSGVAIMTDSDNTGESAAGFYGDIVFKSEN